MYYEKRRGSVLKKFSHFVIALLFFTSVLFASDSHTFSTSINGVKNGLNGFGAGLFPVATNYSFDKYFKMIPNLGNARVRAEFDFALGTSGIDGNYAYDTGTPRWFYKSSEQSAFNYKGGTYFNPTSYIYLYLQQPFGKSPVSGGKLVDVRFALYTRYSMALEYNGIFNKNYGSTVFVNNDGSSKAPFGLGTSLPGFPWLQDNHLAWNNYMQLATYWYFYNSTGLDSRDGAYAEAIVEYGPSWFGNTISPKGVSSNFWRAYGYLDERMTLFSIKQNDGKNWMNMYVGHLNSISYVGGDVVPAFKIPGDRLRGSFRDCIWLHFSGPQFIAGDCYSYIELSLNNYVYFGHVVNEVNQSSFASELQSSISGTFHLRLFGFIRFQYDFGYNFNRGIWASNPGWWQNAEVRFYVSV